MREMKDSGIEWVGKIPTDWKIDKIKFHLKRNESRNPGDTIVLSLYRELGIIPKDSRDDNHNITSEDTSKYKYVQPGDFVVNKMKAWQGSVAVSDYEGIVSPAYFVYKFTDNAYYRRYFHYLLRSCYKEEFMRLSGGIRVGQWDLPSVALDNTAVIIPPVQEQKRIANFLDVKCTEIDALAADIQAQIETLEQYKRSIISETVIKGLNPDVEMKDSGMEWIKKIPKEWEVNRIKYLFKSTKGLSITKENLIEEGLPVISYGQIHSKMNTGVTVDDDLCRFVSYDYSKYKSSKIEKFDFAFADTSEDYEGCGNCVYKRTDDELYGGYHVIILKSVNKKDNRYFAYLFQTDVWRKQIRVKVSGVKVYSITQKIINEASVIIPPVQEQKAISNFLDTKCSEINEIIMKRKEQLEVLNEYKKSLIYEYVTGKKEVPEI